MNEAPRIEPVKQLASSTGYTATWPERCDEQWRYGLMLGALRGLRHCVKPEIALKMDKIIEECEPYNAELSDGGRAYGTT